MYREYTHILLIWMKLTYAPWLGFYRLRKMTLTTLTILTFHVIYIVTHMYAHIKWHLARKDHLTFKRNYIHIHNKGNSNWNSNSTTLQNKAATKERKREKEKRRIKKWALDSMLHWQVIK